MWNVVAKVVRHEQQIREQDTTLSNALWCYHLAYKPYIRNYWSQGQSKPPESRHFVDDPQSSDTSFDGREIESKHLPVCHLPSGKLHKKVGGKIHRERSQPADDNVHRAVSVLFLSLHAKRHHLS